MKFQFSGHESFICKHFWLKKGHDFLREAGNFNEEAAVVQLGVGKNMVISINYWLKAFGITDNHNELTQIGSFIFDETEGSDPYLENLGTLWLLHYSLIKTNKASIYNLFFNEFRKSRFEFTRHQLIHFLKKKLEFYGSNSFTEKTMNSDVSVFIRSYLRPDHKGAKIDIEEDFSNLLIDLDMMQTFQTEDAEGKQIEWYKVENKFRKDLPFQIILYSILDNTVYGNSISFKELLSGINSPGSVFALSDEGLFHKIEQITGKYKNIIYTESAGVREIQFKKKPNKWDILHEYYQD
jgi:hypothetical protein